MLRGILRSPLFPISLLIFIIASLSLSLMNTQVLLAKICLWVAVSLTFVWLAIIKYYNQKNPEDRIKPAGIIPYEFREMDEGQQWVTFKACRNVYIYYSLAIPVTALICFVFAHNIVVPIVCIGALGIGQYIVYWTTTYRMLKQI